MITWARSLLLLITFALLPMGALAEEQTTFDLGSEAERNLWEAINISVIIPAADGVRLQTHEQGNILRPLSLSQSIDVIEVTYSSPMGGTFAFVWQTKRNEEKEYLQIPITFAPSPSPTTLTIELGAVGNWDPHPTTIGFGFPPGTDISLQRITVNGWSVSEKFLENIKCFWTFDGLKPSTINFLWGPLLCNSSIARKNLYLHMPPIAHSGMRVIYAFLVIGIAASLTFRLMKRKRVRRAVARDVLVLMLILWVFLDIRMGSELLYNWKTDVESYLQKPVGTRVFRVLRFFPDFAEAIKPLVRDQKHYVLLTPTPVFFTNYIRYQTYPSLPVTPENGSDASIWLAYERPDLTLDTKGRLVENGKPISPPGSITHEFAKGIFIFRTTE